MVSLAEYLNCLLQGKPEWAIIKQISNTVIEAEITPPLASGFAPDTYILLIENVEKGVKVSEKILGEKLPVFCPERHINEDGSLCIGYEAGKNINSIGDARRWWGDLLEHFNCQYTAKRSGSWPLGKGLSHGDAAKIQFKMEEIAKPLGWYSEVEVGLFRNKGWLAGRLPKERGTSRQIVNGRLPCPRGCEYQHYPHKKFDCGNELCPQSCKKQHNSILRTDCPNKEAVTKLVLLETARREYEKTYIESLALKDCCGTMKNCPFKTK